jgi:hypothetical protein
MMMMMTTEEDSRPTKKRKFIDDEGVVTGINTSTSKSKEETKVDGIKAKVDRLVATLYPLLCGKSAVFDKDSFTLLRGVGENVWVVTFKNVKQDFNLLQIQSDLYDNWGFILDSRHTRVLFGQPDFSVHLILVLMPKESYDANKPKGTARLVFEQDLAKMCNAVKNNGDPTLWVMHILGEYARNYLSGDTPKGITADFYYPQEKKGVMGLLMDAFQGGPELKQLTKDMLQAPGLNADQRFTIVIKGWKNAALFHLRTFWVLYPCLVEQVVISPGHNAVFLSVRHALCPDFGKAFNPSYLTLML